MSQTPSRPEPTSRRAEAASALTGEAREAGAASRAQQAYAVGQLRIRSERRGSDHVVAVFGELDLANAHTVEAELRDVESTDATRIVLDLSGLAFIDSTGLTLIIAAHARSRTNGNRLRLRPGSPQVQRIFELTATTDLLPFTTDDRDAPADSP